MFWAGGRLDCARPLAGGGHLVTWTVISWMQGHRADSPTFVSWELPRFRSAGLSSRGGVLQVPPSWGHGVGGGSSSHVRGAGCWQCWKRVGKQWLANLPQLSGRARPGRAGAERPAKPSLGVCTTPELLVWEAVISPNKEKWWFC